MSRAPGNSDDDLAIPLGFGTVGPTRAPPGQVTSAPIVLDLPSVLLEGTDSSPAADDEFLARDAAAASEAGDGRRADALVCGRALLAESAADDELALTLWSAAFDRDPTLSIAFWGLRRALRQRGAWENLAEVIDRRIAAVPSAEGADTRADLWLELGRLQEDRLGRDDDAAQSYRAGLMEVAEHPALLTALLLLGFRRADKGMTVEALSGLLRRPLPPALRASTTARLARLERSGDAPVELVDRKGGDADARAAAAITPSAALDAGTSSRALATLRAALRAVGPDDRGPLLRELSSLARVTTDPATRAELLEEVIAQALGGATAAPVDIVPLLRERARLLRDELANPDAAAEALRTALARAPGHPLVIADLADLIEASQATRDSVDRADHGADGLRALLATVAPDDRPLVGEAEVALFTRMLAALARAGRAADALSSWERHPEVQRERPDLFALDVLLRSATGDNAGLAASFARLGAVAGDGGPDDALLAAHALVVAGTLLERACGEVVRGSAVTNPDDGESDDPGAPDRLYRRALELSPDYGPAVAAVERRLWVAKRWRDLVDLWDQRLARVGGGAGGATAPAGARDQRVSLLENLVAVHRDLLDDPISARRYQDDLLSMGGADARAWVRRHDLELAAAARGQPSSVETRIRILGELADRAGAADAEAALRIEAARVAVEGGDVVTAEALLKQASTSATDTAGMAFAGLERLATGPDEAAMATGRAELTRAEIAQLSATAGDPSGKTDRLRALRFRVAWHARAAGKIDDALAALEPLRAQGDALAGAWSWELARRSNDPALAVALLSAPPAGVATTNSARLEAPSDLGEALERQGDLPAAAAAFRGAVSRGRSVDAALGLLRVGAALGKADLVTQGAVELARLANPATALALAREAALLSLLHGPTGGDAPAASPGDAAGDGDDPMGVVLRWAAGVRGTDAVGAAAGLLALARAVPPGDVTDTAGDRNGLLARAAARARLGGGALAGAVHDQVFALSTGEAAIGVGLADLPVAGKADRIAARVARAERNGGALGYALEIERACDAEARGDGPATLDGFSRALSRDSEGIEALDGIKRLALATGDRRGAARAGVRLGMVLRTSARAAAELSMAGQILEDLSLPLDAAVAYWHALARDPSSTWLYERLRQLLSGRGDGAALDLLYGHRLAVVDESGPRAALLIERAEHRLQKLENRRAAIEDFKRILRIDPDHRASLRHLATLATQMDHFPQAVRFLERLLGLEDDETQAVRLRLELADAHEAAREPGRAVDVLRRAASTRPRDVAPWQRLTDLLLRMGDWSAALAALSSWDAVLEDPAAKADIWVRMGCLVRDHGRDQSAAADAFQTAADLDPLGDGIFHLVALHEQSRAGASARRQALRRAIDNMRRALTTDPLDILRLRRLKELFESLALGDDAAGGASDPRGLAAQASLADDSALAAAGAMVAAQVLALAGEEVDLPPARRANPRVPLPADFWTRLRPPGALGFAAEIWPVLAGAATELVPPRPGSRDRVAAGAEPRLTWVMVAAAAVGLPGIELFLPKTAVGVGSASDTTAVPLEGATPGLLLGRGVLAGDAAARFRVGRALGLLRERAAVFDRMSDLDVTALMTAAAVVSGAPAAAAPQVLKGVEERARVLGKAMSRKDRKALELQASRFGFQAMEAAQFRQAVLAGADRLGLVLAGDVGVAVRSTGQRGDDTRDLRGAAEILADARAVELIRFALSEDYLALRRWAGAVGGGD